MLKSLIKNEFLNTLNSFSSRKISKKSYFVAIAFSIILFFSYLSGIYSLALCQTFEAINALELVPLLAFFACNMILLTFGLLYTGNALFDFKDFDLLISMPIPIKTILSAKLIFIYLVNLCISLAITLSSLAVWQYYSNSSFIIVISIAISAFFTPIIPMIISNLLGIIIAYLSKFAKNKNLFISIATIASLGAFIVLSQNTSTLSPEQINTITTTLQTQMFMFYPISILFASFANGNVFSLFIFIVTCITLALLFVLLVEKIFLPIHHILQSTTPKSKNRNISAKRSSYFLTLIKKEFSMIASITVYAINTLFGLIFALGGSLYLLFIDSSAIEPLIALPQITIFVPLILSAFFALSPTTNCSLSLEGNKFWILKSLPISGKDVFLSKIAFNLILNLPICLLTSFTAIYLLELSFIFAAITFVFPAIICITFSFTGMLLNMQFPNFEWTNPTIVVKQGAPILINMLVMLLLFGTFGFIVNIFQSSAQMTNIVYGLLVIINALLICALYNMVKNRAEKMIKWEKN